MDTCRVIGKTNSLTKCERKCNHECTWELHAKSVLVNILA